MTKKTFFNRQVFSALIFFFFFFAMGLWILSALFKTSSESPELPRLLILAPENLISSFASSPQIVRDFEEAHQCRVEFVAIKNKSLISDAFAPELTALNPDLVLGIDLISLPELQRNLGWKPLRGSGKVEWSEWVKDSVQQRFWPHSWSILTLVYRPSIHNLTITPRSLSELLTIIPGESLVLPSPLQNPLGFLFLHWLWQEHTIEAFKLNSDSFTETLEQLKMVVYKTPNSLKEANKIFQSNEFLVTFEPLSHTISRRLQGNGGEIESLILRRPHPTYIEYAGIPATCIKCELAEEFIRTLLLPRSQKQLMQSHHLLPVIRDIEKNTPFEEITSIVKELAIHKSNKDLDYQKDRELVLKAWKEIFEID